MLPSGSRLVYLTMIGQKWYLKIYDDRVHIRVGADLKLKWTALLKVHVTTRLVRDHCLFHMVISESEIDIIIR